MWVCNAMQYGVYNKQIAKTKTKHNINNAQLLRSPFSLLPGNFKNLILCSLGKKMKWNKIIKKKCNELQTIIITYKQAIQLNWNDLINLFNAFVFNLRLD